MAKHTIYLSKKLEEEIKSISDREGLSRSDVIRRRLEIASNHYQQRIENIENKIEAIYCILELITGEFGYVVGATRASTKNIEPISKEGLIYEAYLRRSLVTFRKNFSNQSDSKKSENA